MFYVLNFDDHRFATCDNAPQAAEHISRMLAEGCSKDSIEIVNGFIDDVRLNVDQFRDLCEEQGVSMPEPSYEPQPVINSRMAGILAFQKNSQMLQRAAEDEKQRKADNLIAQIRALKPRIDELLATGMACVKNGIQISSYDKYLYRDLDSYEKGTFVTNGISHHLGFVQDRGVYNFSVLGIDNGGACGDYDFRTDGYKAYSVHERNNTDIKEPRIIDMEHFLREFDKFESSFYSYVDREIEKQQKSVDQLIAKAQGKARPGRHSVNHDGPAHDR